MFKTHHLLYLSGFRVVSHGPDMNFCQGKTTHLKEKVAHVIKEYGSFYSCKCTWSPQTLSARGVSLFSPKAEER